MTPQLLIRGAARSARPARVLLLGVLLAGAGGGLASAQTANPWTPPSAAPTARYPGEGAQPDARYPGGLASARDSRYAPPDLDAELSGIGAGAQSPTAGGVFSPGAAGRDAPVAVPGAYAPTGAATPASPFSSAATTPSYAPLQPAQPPVQAPAYVPQTPYSQAVPRENGQAGMAVSPYPLGTPTPAPMPAAPLEPAPLQQRGAPAPAYSPQGGSVAVSPVPGTLVPYAVPTVPGAIGVVPMSPVVPGALSPGGYANLPYAGYGTPWPYGVTPGWPYGGAAGLPYGAGAGLPYGGATGLPYGGATGWPYGGATGWPGGFGTGVPGGLGTGWPSGLGTGWPTTGYLPYGFM